MAEGTSTRKLPSKPPESGNKFRELPISPHRLDSLLLAPACKATIPTPTQPLLIPNSIHPYFDIHRPSHRSHLLKHTAAPCQGPRLGVGKKKKVQISCSRRQHTARTSHNHTLTQPHLIILSSESALIIMAASLEARVKRDPCRDARVETTVNTLRAKLQLYFHFRISVLFNCSHQR